eukprot:gene7683-843_t
MHLAPSSTSASSFQSLTLDRLLPPEFYSHNRTSSSAAMATVVPALDLLDAAIAKLDALIASPGASASSTAPKPRAVAPKAETPAKAAEAATPENSGPPPKAAKAKPAASPKTEAPAGGATAVERFSKALLKIARVTTVDEVENSDKLYKLVCAGLKQYVAKDKLLNSLVTVVLNLKAAKLAGQLSEAMILAADTQLPDGSTLVKALVPPEGSEPGDLVYLEGSAPTTTAVKTMKSDDWKSIVAELAVKSSKATLSSTALVTAKGPVTLPSEIPEGAGIH